MKSKWEKAIMHETNAKNHTEAIEAIETIKSGFDDYYVKYNTDFQLRKTVSDILMRSGFCGSGCYDLMMDIILQYIKIENPMVALKDVYRMIAEKYNKRSDYKPLTIENIDRAIRSGIKKAWNKFEINNIFYLNEYFKIEFFNEKVKPTSKVVIKFIVDRLKLIENCKR